MSNERARFISRKKINAIGQSSETASGSNIITKKTQGRYSTTDREELSPPPPPNYSPVSDGSSWSGDPSDIKNQKIPFSSPIKDSQLTDKSSSPSKWRTKPFEGHTKAERALLEKKQTTIFTPHK